MQYPVSEEELAKNIAVTAAEEPAAVALGHPLGASGTKLMATLLGVLAVALYGISSERAMMALCEVRPPVSVATPRIESRRSAAVSDGVRSWATRIVSPGRSM